MSVKRWRIKWQPGPVFLPGKSHEQRSLAGYSPGGGKGSDTTEQLRSAATTVKDTAPKKGTNVTNCVFQPFFIVTAL